MFLGIDLGTSSLKALVLDVDGGIVGRASASYTMATPQPGWSEADPEDWWQAAGTAARQAAGDHATEIAAVGVSGQMHGVVLSDDIGQPLRPAILWSDGRTRRQLDDYRTLSEDLRRKLANGRRFEVGEPQIAVAAGGQLVRIGAGAGGKFSDASVRRDARNAAQSMLGEPNTARSAGDAYWIRSRSQRENRDGAARSDARHEIRQRVGEPKIPVGALGDFVRKNPAGRGE